MWNSSSSWLCADLFVREVYSTMSCTCVSFRIGHFADVYCVCCCCCCCRVGVGIGGCGQKGRMDVILSLVLFV